VPQEAYDAFLDDRFFLFPDVRLVPCWARVINLILARDKAAFPDLVGGLLALVPQC
jgi:hypothetical protein